MEVLYGEQMNIFQNIQKQQKHSSTKINLYTPHHLFTLIFTPVITDKHFGWALLQDICSVFNDRRFTSC